MLSWLFTLGLEACTAVMDCFIFVVAGRAQSSCRHPNKLSLITNAAWHIMYIDVDRLAGQQLTQDSAPWHNYAQMTPIGRAYWDLPICFAPIRALLDNLT